MLGNKEIDSPWRLRRLMNEMWSMLDETHLIVIHGYDISAGTDENMWFYKNNVHGWHVEDFKNLEPTEHYEFREDGYWARVYKVVTFP